MHFFTADQHYGHANINGRPAGQSGDGQRLVGRASRGPAGVTPRGVKMT